MPDSRFTHRTPATRQDAVTITLDGTPISVQPGIPLAAALLAHSPQALRDTGASGAPRTPFCMMGVCFDCLATVNGRPNVQTCKIEVTEGMTVDRQHGFRPLTPEAT